MGGGLIQHVGGGGGCREPVLVMVGTRVLHSLQLILKKFAIKKFVSKTDKKVLTPIIISSTPPLLHKQEGF